MKKLFLYLCFVVLLIGQSKRIALGAALYDGKISTDYAMNAKIWLDSIHTIQASFILGDNAQLKTDYIWNIPRFSDHYDPIYFGLGTVVGIKDFSGIGIETTVGINVYMYDNEMEAFMELSPTYFLKSKASGIYWQVGLRYYISK